MGTGVTWLDTCSKVNGKVNMAECGRCRCIFVVTVLNKVDSKRV